MIDEEGLAVSCDVASNYAVDRTVGSQSFAPADHRERTIGPSQAPSTSARRAWPFPAFVMPPWCRCSPDECSDGDGVRPR